MPYQLTGGDKQAIQDYAKALDQVAKALDVVRSDFLDSDRVVREVLRIAGALQMRFGVRVLKVPKNPSPGGSVTGPRRGDPEPYGPDPDAGFAWERKAEES